MRQEHGKRCNCQQTPKGYQLVTFSRTPTVACVRRYVILLTLGILAPLADGLHEHLEVNFSLSRAIATLRAVYRLRADGRDRVRSGGDETRESRVWEQAKYRTASQARIECLLG